MNLNFEKEFFMEIIFKRYKILFVISLIVPFTLFFTDYGKEFLFQRGVILSILIYFLVYHFGAVKNYHFAQFAMKVFAFMHLLVCLAVLGFILIA
jgi:hypothetical protein